MKNLCIILIISILTYVKLYAQPNAVGATHPDKVLTREVAEALQGFHGEVGVYIRNLRTGRTVEINADSLFPTASMVKVPILCGVFDKLEKGELKYDQVLTYRDSLHYDDGVVGSLRDSAQIPLSYVLMLMETLSDNTGSLWMQALAGGGTSINEWMERQGFQNTRVNSRTPGRQEAQKT